MLDIVYQYGYLGLFILSFLSSTLLPLTAEVAVVFMVQNGYSGPLTIAVATLGNYLGALVNYYIGKDGVNFILSRYIKIKPESLQKAKKVYKRLGVWSLLFSWVPIIGDPLTIVAGILKTDIIVFTILVVSGKVVRYIVLLYVIEWLASSII